MVIFKVLIMVQMSAKNVLPIAKNVLILQAAHSVPQENLCITHFVTQFVHKILQYRMIKLELVIFVIKKLVNVQNVKLILIIVLLVNKVHIFMKIVVNLHAILYILIELLINAVLAKVF